jgi:hypothetical protein
MRAIHYFLLLTALVVLYACDEKSDFVIFDDTAGEDLRYGDYYVDDQGNEGVVAYISLKAQPSFILVVSIDETFLPWGPMGESVCDNDTVNINVLTNPSFGLSMLQAMQAKGISRFPAMAWCNRKNGSETLASASSWRLPTRYELNLIFANMNSLNNVLDDLDGTPVRSGRYYWTCLEDYETSTSKGDAIDPSECDCANRALPVNASNVPPADKDYWLKKNQYYVRAVKYLYFKNY